MSWWGRLWNRGRIERQLEKELRFSTYLVNQRVPEMGVRMALGASAHQVMWLMLNQRLGMILTGMGIGVVAAFAAGHVLLRLVEGMRSIDASAFAVMLPILVAAALFASFVPARRAGRVDPMKALRQE